MSVTNPISHTRNPYRCIGICVVCLQCCSTTAILPTKTVVLYEYRYRSFRVVLSNRQKLITMWFAEEMEKQKTTRNQEQYRVSRLYKRSFGYRRGREARALSLLSCIPKNAFNILETPTTGDTSGGFVPVCARFCFVILLVFVLFRFFLPVRHAPGSRSPGFVTTGTQTLAS